jgi:hypothetical protein
LTYILDHPLLLLVVALIVLRFAARFGTLLAAKFKPMGEKEHDDLNVIVAAALTLLGLIIGFTFSMALTRYDQRKNYEEEEANAIGTEYLRVNLLPASDTARIQQTLREYLNQRIAFYENRNDAKGRQIDADTARLQSDLWNQVEGGARANPTSIVALVVAGMNDVLNRQGYSQAAWWNRIPIAAWGLMSVIAIACNILIGYSAHIVDGKARRHFVFPLIVAISFLLIADIDSPAHGIIRVYPQNLEALARSLQP